MTNADVKIVDANPKDPFDFSIDHYNQQLVAGYSKNTPRYGLVARVPDYYKIRKTSPTENFGKTNFKPAESRESSSKRESKTEPPVETSTTNAFRPKQPEQQRPEKRGFFARLMHLP